MSKAKLAILKVILRQGPFVAYITCGYTGLGKSRVTFQKEPDGFNVAAFNWLKDKNLIRCLGTDNFKQLWDISTEGVTFLKMKDQESAQIDTRLIERRLRSPFDNYSYDELGFIGRNNTNLNKASVASIGEESLDAASHSSPALSAAARALDSSARKMRSLKEGPSFSDSVNAVISIIEEYLKYAVGSLEVQIWFRFTDKNITYINMTLKPRSHDASKADEKSLNHLLQSFRSPEQANKYRYEIDRLRVVISRTKEGNIESGCVPPEFDS